MKTLYPSNRLSRAFPAALAEVDSLVDQLLHSGGGRLTGWQVPLAVWEADDRIYLDLDAPGVKLEDVEITFEEGRLAITVERRVPEHDGKEWHSERSFGKVRRTLSLPDSADPESIEATLSEGVLHVVVAKVPAAQPKKIEVKGA